MTRWQAWRSQPKYCLESGERGNFQIILSCLQDPISSEVPQPRSRATFMSLGAGSLGSMSFCLLAVLIHEMLPGSYPRADGFTRGLCVPMGDDDAQEGRLMPAQVPVPLAAQACREAAARSVTHQSVGTRAQHLCSCADSCWSERGQLLLSKCK